MTVNQVRLQMPDGHISVMDFLQDEVLVRAKHNPARTTLGIELPETVTLYIGGTQVSLPPDVWRTVIDLVQQELPEAGS